MGIRRVQQQFVAHHARTQSADLAFGSSRASGPDCAERDKTASLVSIVAASYACLPLLAPLDNARRLHHRTTFTDLSTPSARDSPTR